MRGMVLHHVKAGRHSTRGCGAVVGDDPVNVLHTQRIGGLQAVALIKKLFRDKAAMPKLDPGLSAGIVDRLGDLSEALDILVGVKAIIEIGVRLRADRRYLQDIQSAAAGGASRVIGSQIVPHVMFVPDHFCVHAGQQDAVFQFQSPDLDCAEQRIVAHRTSPFRLKSARLFGRTGSQAVDRTAILL